VYKLASLEMLFGLFMKAERPRQLLERRWVEVLRCVCHLPIVSVVQGSISTSVDLYVRERNWPPSSPSLTNIHIVLQMKIWADIADICLFAVNAWTQVCLFDYHMNNIYAILCSSILQKYSSWCNTRH
jgi:hypothetical protein